jgi:hypothetical protein
MTHTGVTSKTTLQYLQCNNLLIGVLWHGHVCLWPLCNTASYTSLVSVCFNLVRCKRMGGWGDRTDSIIPNIIIPGLPGCFLERIPTRIFVTPTWPVAVNDGVPAFFLELHHAGFLMLEDPTSRLQNNSFSIFLLVRIYYIMYILYSYCIYIYINKYIYIYV